MAHPCMAGGVFITVLATASANSALFTRYYTELLVANALIVATASLCPW